MMPFSKSSRASLVGFAALTFILTAGAAQSLSGSNTVFSDDIVDGQVKFADIKPSAVTSSRIANGGVFTSDIANNTVTGTDVNESTLVLTCPAGTTQLSDFCFGPEKAAANFQSGIQDCNNRGMHYPTLSEGTLIVQTAGGSDQLWVDNAGHDTDLGAAEHYAIRVVGGIGYNYFAINTASAYRCVIGLGARLPVGVIASEDDDDADVGDVPPAN